jgi:hypothetical protein
MLLIQKLVINQKLGIKMDSKVIERLMKTLVDRGNNFDVSIKCIIGFLEESRDEYIAENISNTKLSPEEIKKAHLESVKQVQEVGDGILLNLICEHNM